MNMIYLFVVLLVSIPFAKLVMLILSGLVGRGLCRVFGPENLMRLCTVAVLVTIATTAFPLTTLEVEAPQREQPASVVQDDRVSPELLHSAWSELEPEDNGIGSSNEMDPIQKSSDPVIENGKVWKAVVAAVTFWPATVFPDRFHWADSAIEQWSEKLSQWDKSLPGTATFVIVMSTIPIALCIMFVGPCLMLPISVSNVLTNYDANSGEPPFSERVPVLGWAAGLVVLVALNDAEIVVLPDIAVLYLAWLCCFNVIAFSQYALDKSRLLNALARCEQVKKAGNVKAAEMIEAGASDNRIDHYYDTVDIQAEEAGKADRIPERSLQRAATLGGWIGAMVGQRLLWHKVSAKKIEFRTGLASGVFAHAFIVCSIVWGFPGLMRLLQVALKT